jgi:hypothetical protein
MAYSLFQQERIDAGCCKDCGGDRGELGTSVFCRPCADRHSRRQSARKAKLRAEWAAAGDLVCNTCGAPLLDNRFKRCTRCREAGKASWAVHAPARRQQRAAAGICLRCPEPALLPSRYCRLHTLENSLRKYRIPKSRYEEFWQKLAAQDFRCYYTGVALVPGVNASLDHRVPRSRGGDPADADNTVWCDRLINAFKNDLTEAEFVERCRMVAMRFS